MVIGAALAEAGACQAQGQRVYGWERGMCPVRLEEWQDVASTFYRRILCHVADHNRKP